MANVYPGSPAAAKRFSRPEVPFLSPPWGHQPQILDTFLGRTEAAWEYVYVFVYYLFIYLCMYIYIYMGLGKHYQPQGGKGEDLIEGQYMEACKDESIGMNIQGHYQPQGGRGKISYGGIYIYVCMYDIYIYIYDIYIYTYNIYIYIFIYIYDVYIYNIRMASILFDLSLFDLLNFCRIPFQPNIRSSSLQLRVHLVVCQGFSYSDSSKALTKTTSNLVDWGLSLNFIPSSIWKIKNKATNQVLDKSQDSVLQFQHGGQWSLGW